jgi:hypothetical protein
VSSVATLGVAVTMLPHTICNRKLTGCDFVGATRYLLKSAHYPNDRTVIGAEVNVISHKMAGRTLAECTKLNRLVLAEKRLVKAYHRFHKPEMKQKKNCA